MDIPNLRWWGWGTLDQDYSLEGRTAFWPTLQAWLELPGQAIEYETPPVSLDDIALPSSRPDDPLLSSLRKLLGEEAVHTAEGVPSWAASSQPPVTTSTTPCSSVR